jgi:glycosyltransferase involved in cell wall biosynthesis
VAKTGWFSCRTACYLAAGKPAVVQETGWSQHIPSDKGVLPFSTIEEAADALSKVEHDYSTHSKRAREIAEEFFDARKVCRNLLAFL